MTRAIEVYESSDGTRWDRREDAETRDRLDASVRLIEAWLPKTPDKGRVRIPLSDALVREVRHAIILLCRKWWPTEKVFQADPESVSAFGWAGRFLSEVGGPVNRVWFKLSCIGRDQGQWFLYEQPFYAINQNKWHEQYGQKVGGR